MIRTVLSFGLLFGGLLFVSKWLHESPCPAPAAAPDQSPPADGRMPVEARPIPPAHAVFEANAGLPRGFERNSQVRLVSFDDEALDEVLSRLQSSHHTSGPAAGAERSAVVSASNEADLDQQGGADQPSERKEPDLVLTPELLDLRTRLRDCLAWYYFRPENVALRSPWGAMHWMIAYGVDSELIAGDRRVNAIGYLCYNGVCNGQQLFHTTNRRIDTRIGPGVQGHPGQFLAMLAQSRVKTDYPMAVEGQRFTVADLIQHEKETCRPRTELTFKLISFSHYLRSDEQWYSNDGQVWDIPRLIKEELAQPIVGAACGGTHRMTGFSYAVRRREQRGEPITGQWLRAKKFVEDFHEYAFKLQNPDGSFSTDWFAGRADSGLPPRRLETTGHITEWLACSLSKEQLVEPRMVHSVSYLTNLLMEHRSEKWGIGPLGHGLHALAIFDERIFGGQPGNRASELARTYRTRRSVER